MTALRCAVTDLSGSANAQCQLDRFALLQSEASVQMAQTTLDPVSETPVFHVLSDSSIAAPVIANETYEYVAQVYLSDANDPSTRGISIEYTVTGSFHE